MVQNIMEGFAKTPDGNIDFGEIDRETASIINRQAGIVRLEEGDNRYGKIHLLKRHGKEIFNEGYKTIEEFIWDVTNNYTKIYEGWKGALILHKKNGRDKLAIIILKPNDDGGFYSVVSAFISREGYFQKYKLLWERAQSNHPVARTPSAFSGQSSLFPNTSKIVTESAMEIKKKSSEELDASFPLAPQRLDPKDEGSRMSPYKTRKTLLILLALGFILRAWGLDRIPPALNSDELLKSFDGASVYGAGRDHHGHRWPLFFQQSGEYSPPLYIYFAGCFSAPFGVNAYTARLPSAVMGTLSILMTYLVVLEFAGVETALIAAALTAISPWNIHYSRIGWEAVMEAPVQLAAFWLFLRWTRTRRLRELAASCYVFALTVYTYPAARLFIPLMMLGFLILYRHECREYLVHSIVGFFVFLAALLPYVLFTIKHYNEMQARWKFLSVFQRDDGWQFFFLHYLEHLSPSFLFWKGNPYSLHLMAGGIALATLFPFFLAGLYFILKKREKPHLFLMLWLLAFAIPSSMTYDRYDIHSMPNPLRAICGLNLIEIVSAIGIVFLIGKISLPLYRRWVKAVLAAVILVNFSLTAYDYVFRYPVSSAPSWQYGLREAVEFLEQNKSQYERVIVSQNVRLHPIALAVFSGREPAPFSGADYPKYILPFFHYVPIYGDFRHNEYLRYRGVDYGSIARWRNLAPGKNLYLAKAGEIDGEQPIFRNFNPNGDAAYEVYATDR